MVERDRVEVDERAPVNLPQNSSGVSRDFPMGVEAERPWQDGLTTYIKPI